MKLLSRHPALSPLNGLGAVTVHDGHFVSTARLRRTGAGYRFAPVYDPESDPDERDSEDIIGYHKVYYISSGGKAHELRSVISLIREAGKVGAGSPNDLLTIIGARELDESFTSGGYFEDKWPNGLTRDLPPPPKAAPAPEPVEPPIPNEDEARAGNVPIPGFVPPASGAVATGLKTVLILAGVGAGAWFAWKWWAQKRKKAGKPALPWNGLGTTFSGGPTLAGAKTGPKRRRRKSKR